jgi:hypothetical protein
MLVLDILAKNLRVALRHENSPNHLTTSFLCRRLFQRFPMGGLSQITGKTLSERNCTHLNRVTVRRELPLRFCRREKRSNKHFPFCGFVETLPSYLPIPPSRRFSMPRLHALTHFLRVAKKEKSEIQPHASADQQRVTFWSVRLF